MQMVSKCRDTKYLFNCWLADYLHDKGAMKYWCAQQAVWQQSCLPVRSSGKRVVHASDPIQVTGIPSLHLIVQRLAGKPIISQRFTCIALQCSIYVDYTATIQTFSSVHQLHTFMSVDPRVDRATFPPTFWSGGDALSFVFPYFFGVDFFVLMYTVFVGWLEQFSLNLVS